MSEKAALARAIEELDALVRVVTRESREVEACIVLADKVVEHWDGLLKPVLRKSL